MKLFTRVARLGSFSAAARELGLSQPHASRIISELEAELGSQLLSRSTRAVVLNDLGAEYLARIDPILDALEEADQSVRGGDVLQGTLRVGAPTSVALRVLIPLLPRFGEKQPALHVHVIMQDKPQDLVREAVDVAIRVGRLGDSSATAKLLAKTPRVIVAAPAYLEKTSMPRAPEDLTNHHIVGGPATSVASAWRFERGGRTVTVDLEPHLSTSENEGAVRATVAGGGVTSTTAESCRQELLEGRLVRILTEWTMEQIPIHAYFPMGRATRAPARALIDFVVQELGGNGHALANEN